MEVLHQRERSCTGDDTKPATRVLRDRKGWRRYPPIGSLGAREELGMPDTLEVESERPIER
jgi:hypothetical protein